MNGKCALYKNQTDLKLSHIIPKFAFDYLKLTGGKYLRTYENPNKRVQDGPKEYLLSEEAEKEFSKRERWFANNIFFPYLKENKTEFTYNENFAYFTLSVFWRVLLDQLNQPSVKDDPRLYFLKDVAEEWRLFLSEYKYPHNYDDLNIFLTDRITSHNTNGLNVDLFFSRIIDSTIVTDEDGETVIVYFKFLRFIFWSVVKGKLNKDQNIKIQFNSGNLKVPQEIRDDFFGGFIKNRIEEIDNRPKANEIQQNKILKEIEKNEEEFWSSDAGKAMINDYVNKTKASR